MARVRRINVSQVEGDFSNDSDKRPNGEMGLYEDGNGGFDLVIHDGTNGTNKNRVLSKGKFYGHGADSGDGNGYDTIKLIPDLGLYNNDQYIIIDPTAPNHIHIRAGGDQDNSSADLFLGGENTNVKVSDNGEYVSINSTGSYQWVFDSAGNLQFPDNTQQTTAWTGGRVVEAPQSSIGSAGDLEGDLAFNSSYIYYCIENYGGTQYQVVHGVGSSADGVNSGYLVYDNYQLPQVGWQVNYGGNSAIIDQVNTSNPGYYIVFVSTTLVIPGDATFSWGPVPLTNIWKRISWSEDTW